jgi:hypothetical protein
MSDSEEALSWNYFIHTQTHTHTQSINQEQFSLYWQSHNVTQDSRQKELASRNLKLYLLPLQVLIHFDAFSDFCISRNVHTSYVFANDSVFYY